MNAAAIATLLFAPIIYAVDQPQAVVWSEKSYGPDGPWAAVTVQMGTPWQSVDLLPGGSWMTNVLEKGICNGTTKCAAEDAGLYDYRASETWEHAGGTGKIDRLSMHDIVGAVHSVTMGDARWTFDNMQLQADDGGAGYTVEIELQRFDMLAISRAEQTLPDGSKYPLTIGKLALGAPEKNQSWQDGPTKPRFNGTLLTSAVFDQERTQSNSYSLHVGSPSMNLPGSLVLGGYHKERVLGSVSYQPYALDSLPIDLLDISIGVAEGSSPFNFTKKSGILADGDSSFAAGQQVTVDATQPYLYLPPTTCAALASHLPVKFQPKYGIYFWDTTNPQYEKIITSPSFLEFTFRESASVSTNITVKLPFALLNLTLSTPLINTPTPYFPCFGGQDPTEKWSLGRAFLQAALIGVKWEDKAAATPGSWFLAQAPGPNTPKTIAPTSITAAEELKVETSKTKWEDTWKGIWTVLEVDGTTSNNASTTPGSSDDKAPDSSGSSSDTAAVGVAAGPGDGGSKIPIAAIVGAAVGGAALIIAVVVAFICYRRRKAKHVATKSPESDNGSPPSQAPLPPLPVGAPTPAAFGRWDEKNRQYQTGEMDGYRPMPEMAGQSYHGRFGQQEGQEWKGNGYAHHGQGLGMGGGVPVGSNGRPAELYVSPSEMYAPAWSHPSERR